MFRKFALITLMSLTCLVSTPNKAKAYIPITEIILGVQLASALVVAAEPLIKIAFRAAKKGTKMLVAYIQNRRARYQRKQLTKPTLIAQKKAPGPYRTWGFQL